MFEQVKSFLISKTNCSESEIKPETELISLGIDSLQLLMIITDFEEEFKVSISDNELEKIHTVQDIVNILENSK